MQRVNIAKLGEVQAQRVIDLKHDAGLMIDNLVAAARANHKQGGKCAIEWPSGCEYWRDARILSLLEELGMRKAHAHGCAWGLVDPKGIPVKKPWTIATNDDFLFATCEAAKCPGPDTYIH